MLISFASFRFICITCRHTSTHQVRVPVHAAAPPPPIPPPSSKLAQQTQSPSPSPSPSPLSRGSHHHQRQQQHPPHQQRTITAVGVRMRLDHVTITKPACAATGEKLLPAQARVQMRTYEGHMRGRVTLEVRKGEGRGRWTGERGGLGRRGEGNMQRMQRL